MKKKKKTRAKDPKFIKNDISAVDYMDSAANIDSLF